MEVPCKIYIDSNKDDIEEETSILRTVKMRNLKNIRYEQWTPPSHQIITATAWENDSNFLCTFGPSEESALIELVRVNPASK